MALLTAVSASCTAHSSYLLRGTNKSMLMGLKIMTHIFQSMQPMNWSARTKKNLRRRSEHLAVNASLQVFSTSHHKAGGRQAEPLISSLLGITFRSELMKWYQPSWQEVQEDAIEWMELWFVPGTLSWPRRRVPLLFLSPWKTGHGNTSRTFKWMSVPCQNSEGILATQF